MNKKLMLLALAAVSAAIFALPSVASAELAHISSTGKFTLANKAGTNTTLTEHEKTTKVTCTQATGNGEFTTTTKGTITISFHGCTENVFSTSCTGEVPSHEPAGTITTTLLEFHLIEIDNNTPGVLITPKEGHFATFTCAGGLVTKKVGGNGIIGHITAACGEAKVSQEIDFHSTNETTPGDTQKYTQITTAGTKFDLTSNGVTAAQDGTGSITFSDGKARSIVCT